MNIFILAAGKGTRLEPLTNRTPKPLIPFLNKPMINYNLELFNYFKFNNFIINISHQKEKFKTFIPFIKNISIKYSFEEKLLGTGGGIKKASLYFEDSPTIVMNGDIFYDFNILSLVNDYKKENNPLAILVVKENKSGNITANNGVITSLRGKQSNNYKNSDKHYSFTGLHILSQEVISKIDEFCIIDTYIKLLNSNRILIFIDTQDSFWADLGTFDSYLKNSQYLISNYKKLNYLKGAISPKLFNLSSYNFITNSIVGKNIKLLDPTIIIKDSVIFDDFVQKEKKDIIDEILF